MAFLKRVAIKNYKSIAACDVTLGALTFLVGPNGSGKSNFLDALRFLADALNYPMDHAMQEHGGFEWIKRSSSSQFGIHLEAGIGNFYAEYMFEIGDRNGGGYTVLRESCLIGYSGLNDSITSYDVRDGRIVSSVSPFQPPLEPGHLYLPRLYYHEGYETLIRLFTHMGFYNLEPAKLRVPTPSASGDLLSRDGTNLPSVIRALGKKDPARKKRVESFLSAIVPQIESVEGAMVGPWETIEFTEAASQQGEHRIFYPSNVSDGTLRALGVLVALAQDTDGPGGTPLIGIEEPEAALHPGAAGVLFDCLMEASKTRQIVVTSHSPDLLDRDDIPPESILAVTMESGKTLIGPLDPGGNRVLKQRLQTAGELLRMNQLTPSASLVADDIEFKFFEPR